MLQRPFGSAVRAGVRQAFSAGLDAVCGRLEAGKRADLLVLSADPLECPPLEIARIRVQETWVGGVRHPNPP